MLRVIREVQPRWVVGENVLGLVNWNGGLVFEEVQADLEAEGYEVQPFILPAASVNAPHKRDRVWFVAYRNATDTECVGFYRQTNEQELERKGCNELHLGKSGNKGFATNTDHNGYATAKNGQGLGEGNDRNKTRQNYAIEFEGRAVSDGVAPDTDSARISGQSINAGTSQEIRQGGEGFEKAWDIGLIGGWDNFPTKPPICSRNDGLPTELDGITFSKWRNESIKAGGNAIVPQVVYQIFKAINEYREKYP